MDTFNFRTMSADEAAQRRKELGAGRGGRKSKYSPVGDKISNLRPGQVLAMTCAPNQIISLRNYVTRNFGGRYKVASRRVGDEQFEIHISAADAASAPKRGRRKKGED